jgi:hypothetical protein
VLNAQRLLLLLLLLLLLHAQRSQPGLLLQLIALPL